MRYGYRCNHTLLYALAEAGSRDFCRKETMTNGSAIVRQGY